MIHYNTKKESNGKAIGNGQSQDEARKNRKTEARNNIKLKLVGGAYSMTVPDNLYQATRQKRYSQTALALGADGCFSLPFFSLLFSSSSLLHILNQASQQQYMPYFHS